MILVPHVALCAAHKSHEPSLNLQFWPLNRGLIKTSKFAHANGMKNSQKFCDI